MDPYLYIALELDYPTLKNLCAISPKFGTICNSNVMWAKKFKLDFPHLDEELFTDLNKLLDSNRVPSKDIYHLALLMDNQYNGESINYPLIIKNSTELPHLRVLFDDGEYTRRIKIYIDRLLAYSSPDIIDKVLYYIDKNITRSSIVTVERILEVINDAYNKYIDQFTDKDSSIGFTNKVNSLIERFRISNRAYNWKYNWKYGIDLIAEILRHN